MTSQQKVYIQNNYKHITFSEEPKKGVQFNEFVQVKTLKPAPEQVEIEEDKIDK